MAIENILVRKDIPRRNATYHITPKAAKTVTKLAKIHASTQGKIVESAIHLLEKTLENGTEESNFIGDRRAN